MFTGEPEGAGHEMSDDSVSDLRQELEKENLRRELWRARLNRWGEAAGWGTSKMLGLFGLGGGGLEWLDPSLLPLSLSDPQAVFGVGLALMVGKKALDLIPRAPDGSK